jgi:hypothetical protein
MKFTSVDESAGNDATLPGGITGANGDVTPTGGELGAKPAAPVVGAAMGGVVNGAAGPPVGGAGATPPVLRDFLCEVGEETGLLLVGCVTGEPDGMGGGLRGRCGGFGCLTCLLGGGGVDSQ